MKPWRTLCIEFSAMASPCSVQMDGQDEHAMRQAATEAVAEVQRIEKKYSRYLKDSVIGRINAAAGGQFFAVDEETRGLLDFAQSLWTLSEGLFDCTSGVLRHAWDFKTGQLPESKKLKEMRALVGWEKVSRDADLVQLRHPGMELDFGGFGKEYAADRAAAVLLRHGFAHALVNLGGDLHALGARALPELQGQPWQIEITHPRPEQVQAGVPLAQLPLSRGGLATSGDYERYFIKDGVRYCHVLNPLTGWPVSHWQSVSVLAANTTTSGALATIAMLKGEHAIEWLNTQDVHYLAVQHDGQLLRSAAAHSLKARP